MADERANSQGEPESAVSPDPAASQKPERSQDSVRKKEWAWQPLTPHGVAAFANAAPRRLFIVELLFALVAAAVVVWFVQNAWFRAVQEAISHLPRSGEIRSGKLQWDGPPGLRLAENRFLSLAVDLEHTGDARSPAHIQLEFGRADLQVGSLFGYLRLDYPKESIMAFNLPQLQPWWGAWRPPILALIALAVIGVLLLTWSLLALLYSVPVWLVAFYGDRNLTLRQSRLIAGAALMPGALFLTVAIAVYGLGAMDVVQLLAAAAGHFVIGWIYLVLAPLALRADPRLGPPRKNPFGRKLEKGTTPWT